MGLTFDRDAEDHGGAGLETRKEWEECIWEVDGPRVPKRSVTLTLGAIDTDRQTDETGILFCGIGHSNGPDHPTKASLPGLETSELSQPSPAGKPALGLGLCRHRALLPRSPAGLRNFSNGTSAGTNITLGTDQLGELDITSSHLATAAGALNARREKLGQSGPRTNIFGQE